MTHGEFSKIKSAIAEPQKIAPLLNPGHGLFRISVNFLEIRIDDADFRQFPMNVGRWNQLLRIEKTSSPETCIPELTVG